MADDGGGGRVEACGIGGASSSRLGVKRNESGVCRGLGLTGGFAGVLGSPDGPVAASFESLKLRNPSGFGAGDIGLDGAFDSGADEDWFRVSNRAKSDETGF